MRSPSLELIWDVVEGNRLITIVPGNREAVSVWMGEKKEKRGRERL